MQIGQRSTLWCIVLAQYATDHESIVLSVAVLQILASAMFLKSPLEGSASWMVTPSDSSDPPLRPKGSGTDVSCFPGFAYSGQVPHQQMTMTCFRHISMPRTLLLSKAARSQCPCVMDAWLCS